MKGRRFMDIRKEPGGVARHSPDREDMVLINRLAREIGRAHV